MNLTLSLISRNHGSLSTCLIKGNVRFSMSLMAKCKTLRLAHGCVSNRPNFVWIVSHKVRKMAKIRKRHNQVSHLTQDTTWESNKIQKHHQQERAGDHKAAMNRRESMRNTNDSKNTNDPQKKYRLGTVSKIFYLRVYTGFSLPTSPLVQMLIKTPRCLVCMKGP